MVGVHIPESEFPPAAHGDVLDQCKEEERFREHVDAVRIETELIFELGLGTGHSALAVAVVASWARQNSRFAALKMPIGIPRRARSKPPRFYVLAAVFGRPGPLRPVLS